MPQATLRDRVGALHEKLGRDMPAIRAAMQERGIRTLSQFLEAEDPSEPYERQLGFDAYTRMMIYADIRVTGDRVGSFFASPLDAFDKDPNTRGMFPEFCRRQWSAAGSPGRIERERVLRDASQAQVLERMTQAMQGDTEVDADPLVRAATLQRANAQFLSGDFGINTINRPYDDDPTLSIVDLEPAVPLTEIIARTKMLDGADYRKRYLVDPPVAQIRMLRVAEFAELPTATITMGQRVIRLYKFGRRLEASYESLRRLPLDEFAIWIRKMRVQTEVDQVSAASDVLINGDGNANTAAVVYNLTTLDPATTANNMTIDAWWAYKLLWTNPYVLTTVLARQAAIAKLLKLNVGTANTLLASSLAPDIMRQPWVPINQRLADGVRWGVTLDVAANYVLGFDGRFAVEHIEESGSQISEAERWITNQTETVTFSFNEAFAVFDPLAAKMLNLAA